MRYDELGAFTHAVIRFFSEGDRGSGQTECLCGDGVIYDKIP